MLVSEDKDEYILLNLLGTLGPRRTPYYGITYTLSNEASTYSCRLACAQFGRNIMRKLMP